MSVLWVCRSPCGVRPGATGNQHAGDQRRDRPRRLYEPGLRLADQGEAVEVRDRDLDDLRRLLAVALDIDDDET
jgi:hypothetical protein